MAGTAHAAELIPCDRCNGHYVVDASIDGKPRVRCNKCGHLREGNVEASPVSVPGKWTVIGPDGKAVSFDTWEELTESRRPHAIAANAKGMEEADKALKELSSKEAKKSASALLDVTPAPAPTPKLALAEMDSAMDLGEPVGSRPKSRLSPGGSPQSGKLEPLLVRSFHPPSQAPKSKVEWAPRIDAKSLPVPSPSPAAKSDMVPRGDHDHTLRVDLAPSHRLDAPITAKVIEAERPTAPNMSDGADSIDELDPDSLLEDDEDETSPLSLRDVVQDDELGDDDLEDAPDPHEMLSLRDLVVAPQVAEKTAPMPTVEVRQSHPPPVRPQSSPSLPPKPSAPPRAPATSQPPVVPRSQVATIPPQRPRLSRPDLGVSTPPPSSRAADDLRRRSATRAAVGQEPSNTRNYVLGGLALLVLAGIAWRLLGSNPEAEKPKPAPTSTVATIAPSTPVTAPTTTATETPSATATNDTSTPVDVPVTNPTTTTTPVSTAPINTGAATTSTAKPADTTKKPVAANNTEKPADTTKKPVAVTDTAGSMSDLLDKAGSARRKGDYATARELYTKVIGMSPSNVEANGGLGDVARAQGDLAGAKASYERALAASPTYSPALLGLADVEWDQGNKPSATRRYAQIVDRLGDRAPQRAKERSNSAQ